MYCRTQKISTFWFTWANFQLGNNQLWFWFNSFVLFLKLTYKNSVTFRIFLELWQNKSSYFGGFSSTMLFAFSFTHNNKCCWESNSVVILQSGQIVISCCPCLKFSPTNNILLLHKNANFARSAEKSFFRALKTTGLTIAASSVVILLGLGLDLLVTNHLHPTSFPM